MQRKEKGQRSSSRFDQTDHTLMKYVSSAPTAQQAATKQLTNSGLGSYIVYMTAPDQQIAIAIKEHQQVQHLRVCEFLSSLNQFRLYSLGTTYEGPFFPSIKELIQHFEVCFGVTVGDGVCTG